MISKLANEADPHEAQRQLYDTVIDNGLGKMGLKDNEEIRLSMATPNFPDFASGLWLDDTFIIPVVMGHSSYVGQIIGMLPPERPLFETSLTRGGWFDVSHTKTTIFATESNRKAVALAYSQLVANSTRAVLTDADALAIGLDNAWRLAS